MLAHLAVGPGSSITSYIGTLRVRLSGSLSKDKHIQCPRHRGLSFLFLQTDYFKHQSLSRYKIVSSTSISYPSPLSTMAGTSLSCWYGSTISRPKRDAWSPRYSCAGRNLLCRANAFIQEWTPFLLVSSYFVFSTCMYTFCTEGLIRMFWFTYLVTNFYIAGATFLEAVMSLTPIEDSRKAVRNVQNNGWVFPTPDDELLVLDLVIVCSAPAWCCWSMKTHLKPGGLSPQ